MLFICYLIITGCNALKTKIITSSINNIWINLSLTCIFISFPIKGNYFLYNLILNGLLVSGHLEYCSPYASGNHHIFILVTSAGLCRWTFYDNTHWIDGSLSSSDVLSSVQLPNKPYCIGQVCQCSSLKSMEKRVPFIPGSTKCHVLVQRTG